MCLLSWLAYSYKLVEMLPVCLCICLYVCLDVNQSGTNHRLVILHMQT